MIIRGYRTSDIPEMLSVWNEIVSEGNAFPQDDLLLLGEAESFFASQTYCAVAYDEIKNKICGLYILHPNNVGRCSHIANASFAVSGNCRGMGIGRRLVTDCIENAGKFGFEILQFNAVVASNAPAIRLYEDLGFVRLGTVPRGFRKPDGSFSDIVLFYREL